MYAGQTSPFFSNIKSRDFLTFFIAQLIQPIDSKNWCPVFFQQTSSDFCTLQQNSTAVKVYYQTHSLTPKNVLFGFLFNCFLLQMLLLLKVSMQSQKSLYRWRMYQDYWVEMFNYLAIQNLLPRTIHFSWLFGLKSHLQIPFTGTYLMQFRE